MLWCASFRMSQNQLNCRVKRLYADGGTEFINQTLKSHCLKQGIELHYSPARTQQLNGVAENSVRVIKDGTRAMMIQSWAPRQFWSYAGKHGTFVWNRSHVSDTTGKTPYELMYGKKPSMRSWGVFGCDAYYHVPKEQRDVFAPKMDPCIYLGHDAVQNCATVYVLRTKKIIRTRDVSFRESSFKHGVALTAGADRVLDLLQDGGEPDLLGLRPAESDDAAPQGGEIPAAAADEEESNEYEVDRILAQRKHRKHGQQYLVQWSTQEQTWEPAAMINEDAPVACKSSWLQIHRLMVHVALLDREDDQLQPQPSLRSQWKTDTTQTRRSPIRKPSTRSPAGAPLIMTHLKIYSKMILPQGGRKLTSKLSSKSTWR